MIFGEKTIMEWVNERCSTGENWTAATELYRDYVAWSHAGWPARPKPYTLTRWGMCMGKNFRKSRVQGTIRYHSVELKRAG